MADEAMTRDDFDIESALSDKAHDNDMEKYLIFSSDNILYGVSADVVNEILTDSTVTRIPTLPPHISGVINLRGAFVPIIDFRLLLGRMPAESYCTIVLDLEGVQIGIQADGVDQMVDIAKHTILPVPSRQDQALVMGMCTLPGGGTMMVLDCTRLTHG